MTAIGRAHPAPRTGGASVVVADDLSGAAEVAAFLGGGTPVLLWPAGTDGLAGNGSLVLDADTRGLTPPEASARTTSILLTLDPFVPTVMKIDSLLRGPIAALVAALATPERVVVVAPALPALGRTTVDGVVRLGGVPLAETDAWGAEPVPPPVGVAAALSPLECVSLGLERVRGDGLRADLGSLRGRVVVCDAETVDDLDRIAAATRRVLPAAAIGASALCRAFLGNARAAASAPLAQSPRHCLIVVGTAVPAAVGQVAHLVQETGASEVTPAAGELVTASGAQITGWRRAIEEALARGDVVLRFGDRPRGHTPRAAASALATLVAKCAPVTSGTVDLILTGGQTARSVLDALGVERFTIATEVAPGAIISELPSGALLGTRPGSFGGLDSLLKLRLAMGPAHPHDPMRSSP